MNRLIPFLRNLEGGKVQGFHESRTAWEDISLAVKLLVTAVQALNCIGGIDNLSGRHRELENRADYIPVVIPAFHGIRISLTPLV